MRPGWQAGWTATRRANEAIPSAWQPNPGKRSTYRRGKTVQTTGTTSEGSPCGRYGAAIVGGSSLDDSARMPSSPAAALAVMLLASVPLATGRPSSVKTSHSQPAPSSRTRYLSEVIAVSACLIATLFVPSPHGWLLQSGDINRSLLIWIKTGQGMPRPRRSGPGHLVACVVAGREEAMAALKAIGNAVDQRVVSAMRCGGRNGAPARAPLVNTQHWQTPAKHWQSTREVSPAPTKSTAYLGRRLTGKGASQQYVNRHYVIELFAAPPESPSATPSSTAS